MKVYASWGGSIHQLPSLTEERPVKLLISYGYDDRSEPLATVLGEWVPPEDLDVLCDSGAFQVWTTGTKIDVAEYVEWAKSRRALFGQVEFINLDVIPGAPGIYPTTKERRRAIQESMQNADILRDEGLRVMEVFHLYDGSWQVMEDLWARRKPGEVLGIGGLAGVGTSKNDMLAFGDGVFARAFDWCGGWSQLSPLHGLGISPDSPMGRRYPWWSIDSSSYAAFQKFGKEVRRNGKSHTSELRARGGRSRSASSEAAALFYLWTMRRWRRVEKELTQLWEERGIRFEAIHA